MLKSILNLTAQALIVFLFLGLQSCEKETFTQSKNFPNVDEELWKHFQKFETEAKARGLIIDLVASGITGEIGTTASAMWVGQCNHNVDDPNHLIINQNFWNTSDDLRREKIVFHELGHCVLGREHNDEMLFDGRCKSIMRSGNGGCIDNYTEDSKEKYCDELFIF